jgi:DNA mismatch endonuclease (patch repair protein)
MDVHSSVQRSANMAAIKGKNTRPEQAVRRIVHALGYRYRLHLKDLPGKPDLVFSRHKKVIFVNGCYWHLHDCRFGRVRPVTNAAFWTAKRNGNAARDRRNQESLRKDGWKVLIVWECEVKNEERLKDALKAFLDSPVS